MSPLAPAVRSVVVLTALSGIVAALARPPLPEDARAFVLVVVGAVAAWSARTALLLLAARKGRLVVDARAPTHRLALTALPPALAGGLAGFAAARASIDERVLLVGAALVGALAGAALAHLRDGRAKGPRTTSRLAWLLLDTALPAGCVAALVSAAVGAARLHGQDVVGGAEVARHIAATTFAYAVFLGLGGFAKAFGERAAGLVVLTSHVNRRDAPAPADASARERPSGGRPGPIVTGIALGVVVIFAGPRVLPALPLADVLALKAAVGLVVGGALSLLGALQGERAAAVRRV